MYARDYRDLAGGGLLFVIGLWIGLHAAGNAASDAAYRASSGMPAEALAFVLAALGAAIAVPAWFRGGTVPPVKWRPVIFAASGMLTFAAVIDTFGMVPAVVAMTMASAHAGNTLRLRDAFLLGIALSLIAYLVFGLGLGTVREPFRWPF